jgi:SAM-dependent methyltransferase
MNKSQLIDFYNSRTNKKELHFESYEEYIFWQTKNGESFESENNIWRLGQEHCIDYFFSKIDLNQKIMDVSCGDGVGLVYFKKLGYRNVVGVEINDNKIERCKDIGYEVIRHDLCSDLFDESLTNEFDVIYSSHSLEHVLNPIFTIQNLTKTLKKNGKLFIVLPYPNLSVIETNKNEFMIHCGSIPLGLTVDDNGETLVNIIQNNCDLKLRTKNFDNFREPEIWLEFEKLI